jgi:nucleotide-binding universal stress UspA family protein
MFYRTILMHCNDLRRINGLLTVGVDLAAKFQAHLTALSVVPPLTVVSAGAHDGIPIVVEEHCTLYREENPAMRNAFESAVRGRAFEGQWCNEEAGGVSVAERVLQHARTADLVIATQTDPKWRGTYWLDIADRLVIESGRPVLIVPNRDATAGVGNKVLVAWNARREAARATFDALPILQRASEVRVVWVNPQSEEEVAEDIPAADICVALARHGVKCAATERIAPHANVGEALLSCSRDMQADLLVMGCYGHTRLREFIFGGASRHLLAHMSLPVLMAH